MTTIVHSFTGPKVRAARTGQCPTCGKSVKRTRTFERTVSPFNKHPDGSPKTWPEVRADVQADAEAWTPEPDDFEHERCMAQRLAPPVAAPTPISDEARTRALALRIALADAILWLERTGLPLGRIEIKLPWRQAGETLPVAEVVWIDQAEVPLWARALGLDIVPIEDGGHCEYARLRGEAGGLSWRADAVIQRPEVGDRLGGAPIKWRRDSAGKRVGRGTVSVDDYASGLARMGVSEIVPAPPGAGDEAASGGERS